MASPSERVAASSASRAASSAVRRRFSNSSSATVIAVMMTSRVSPISPKPFLRAASVVSTWCSQLLQVAFLALAAGHAIGAPGDRHAHSCHQKSAIS